ncbi:complex I subunit 5 family protein [Starkeya koreensis]|uniref:Complex I subunit 5 family protein n=1 Tax=Ancylobacter koreensis TaxID=266121 RepID=A0ABT0DRF6_9HYPH|nr:complex I subunit 5 family protein [Ancylobacter koreensis]MCK0209702.1 complex I subunit 5 family protein [Ancylobacter koreensis]
MTLSGLLLLATLATPLAMVGLCLLPAFRCRVFGLLAVAPLPGLATALVAPGGTLLLAPAPFRLVLALDAPGALLLGGAALLWSAAGLYARAYMREETGRAGFAIWWLLTMAGSLGVFVVADMTSFYLMFSLVSLSAYGLVMHESSARAERAGFFYIALALLGEACLLFGFVLLATAGPVGNQLIADAVSTLDASPWRAATLTLLILGFGLKMGLAPLHVWMPLAHPVAPMPASAVLSGIVVKAGVIGLIRFLPFGTPLADWGGALMALGLATAFYGVAIGITQQHPKTVLAYSTVSQMGLVAAIAGAGLAIGDTGVTGLLAYYALHHMLVKGALFLGVGVIAVTGSARRLPVLAVMTVMALSLAGLPFTSGALAKYAAKAPFGDGLAATLATLSAAGSALLMLHFLRLVASTSKAAPEESAPTGMALPFAATALASLVAGWALLGPATGYTLANVLAPAALWAASWPILLGGALAVLLFGFGRRLPRVPEGDVVVLAERAAPLVRALGAGMERLDAVLRRWPIAGLSLVALVLALAGALSLAP